MPMCSICGGPNENMGVCHRCREGREKVIDSSVKAARPSTGNRYSLEGLLFSKFFPALLGVIGVGIVLFLRFVVFAPVPANFSDDGNYFVVGNEDGSTRLRYAYGGHTSISGYIYDGLVQNGSVQEGGILLQLHYLSPSGYASFQKQYGSTKKCAASFYNANMLHTMVLARDRQCAKHLSGRSFSTWEKFTISGRLISFYDGVQNGGRIGMPNGPFNYLLVDSCDQIEEHTVSAGPRNKMQSW